MRLLYLSTWDFTHEESDGVCKKIYSQIAVFEKSGFIVDFIYIKDGKILYRESGNTKTIGRVGAIRKTSAYIKMYRILKNKEYTWVYNRYGMMDSFYYQVLKRLKNNGARILIEIPTYPYAGERPRGILYRLMFWWDALYVEKLENLVERIITYSLDEKIWKIPTIQIKNGIDLCKIQMAAGTNETTDDTIDLLCVALMQPYHGYERLLYGLKNYLQNGGKRKILIHIVGEGPEKENYEKIVAKEKLDSNVIFYGRRGGEELEKIFEKGDIGVCSLGSYKKNVFWSSELKSKEYLAKGMPIIAGVNLDIFDLISDKYYLQFANDSSVIDMEKIVGFYDGLYGTDKKAVAGKIRKMAEKYIDIEETMKPIYEYMKLECWEK